jgi:hypothetical protein
MYDEIVHKGQLKQLKYNMLKLFKLFQDKSINIVINYITSLQKSESERKSSIVLIIQLFEEFTLTLLRFKIFFSIMTLKSIVKFND